jgi:hypothetical protein
MARGAFSAARGRAKGNRFFPEVSISDSKSLLLFEEKEKICLIVFSLVFMFARRLIHTLHSAQYASDDRCERIEN